MPRAPLAAGPRPAAHRRAPSRSSAHGHRRFVSAAPRTKGETHSVVGLNLLVAAGIGLRRVLPGAADRAARVVHAVFVAGLAIGLGAALWIGAPVLLRVPPIVLLAVVVMDFGAVALGRWAAARRPEAQRVTSVAAALGNPGLVLAIVAASRPGFHAAAFVAAYVIARKLALLPYELWAKRREAAHHGRTDASIAA